MGLRARRRPAASHCAPTTPRRPTAAFPRAGRSGRPRTEADNAGLDELGLLDPRMAAILARDGADRRHVNGDETIALTPAAVGGSDRQGRCERLWTALQVGSHGQAPSRPGPSPDRRWLVVSLVSCTPDFRAATRHPVGRQPGPRTMLRAARRTCRRPSGRRRRSRAEPVRRCADVPCVNESGVTRPWVAAGCGRRRQRQRRERLVDVAAAREGAALGSVVRPHAGEQSAWSSTRTDSALLRSARSAALVDRCEMPEQVSARGGRTRARARRPARSRRGAPNSVVELPEERRDRDRPSGPRAVEGPDRARRRPAARQGRAVEDTTAAGV